MLTCRPNSRTYKIKVNGHFFSQEMMMCNEIIVIPVMEELTPAK